MSRHFFLQVGSSITPTDERTDVTGPKCHGIVTAISIEEQFDIDITEDQFQRIQSIHRLDRRGAGMGDEGALLGVLDIGLFARNFELGELFGEGLSRHAIFSVSQSGHRFPPGRTHQLP